MDRAVFVQEHLTPKGSTPRLASQADSGAARPSPVPGFSGSLPSGLCGEVESPQLLPPPLAEAFSRGPGIGKA